MFVLSAFFLVAVISLPLFYVVFWSLDQCIDTILNADMSSSSSFLDTSSLSMSSLGCKARCIVMNFLVLLSIYKGSSQVYFKNGLEYLTRGRPQLYSLVWFGFYSISTFVGYLTPNPFLCE